ncbi:hypothetical protein [Arenimonas sp. MALMAid1274]|uniref:hypothetical protein n=1 Tax=Arenimonas sp. MALMAid1274 TaxID=3411630 RepID=UPI003BA262A3
MSRHDAELSPALARHVQAAADVPQDATDRAQLRLQQALRQPVRRPARARGWWAATASAAVALVLVLGLPLMSGGSDAFAAVQARLRNFQTLSLDIRQWHQDDLISTSRTRMDARGRLRTDVGAQLSVVVDPVRGRVLTLLHDSRQAIVSPVQASGSARESTDWLQELREFQGQATPLPGSRMIDGRPARGWALEIKGQRMEIWADADGWPLQMQLGAPGGIRIDYRLTFDDPIAPGVLDSEVPPGYALVEGDDDSSAGGAGLR